jgi:putative transposase
MTTAHEIDLHQFLADRLTDASPDLIRLVGEILVEQHDERIEGRRYLGLDMLARSRGIHPDGTATEPTQEVIQAALTA